jgi:hypothetical protein
MYGSSWQNKNYSASNTITWLRFLRVVGVGLAVAATLQHGRPTRRTGTSAERSW